MRPYSRTVLLRDAVLAVAAPVLDGIAYLPGRAALARGQRAASRPPNVAKLYPNIVPSTYLEGHRTEGIRHLGHVLHVTWPKTSREPVASSIPRV